MSWALETHPAELPLEIGLGTVQGWGWALPPDGQAEDLRGGRQEP